MDGMVRCVNSDMLDERRKRVVRFNMLRRIELFDENAAFFGNGGGDVV